MPSLLPSWFTGNPIVRRLFPVGPKADDDRVWQWSMRVSILLLVVTIPSGICGIYLVGYLMGGSGDPSTTMVLYSAYFVTVPIGGALVLRGGAMVRYPDRVIGTSIGVRHGPITSAWGAWANGGLLMAFGVCAQFAPLFVF